MVKKLIYYHNKKDANDRKNKLNISFEVQEGRFLRVAARTHL